MGFSKVIFSIARTLIFLVNILFNIIAINALVDQKKLENIAEKQGYGYKYANLVLLNELVATLPQKEKMQHVKIPDFVGISSEQIINALRKKGFDILTEWGKVLDLLTNAHRQEIFKTKQIPENFWEAQKTFVQGLEQAFQGLLKDANPFLLDDKTQLRLQQLFQDSANDKLMVRSTGKEDTRTLANAGGNESIPNVEPTMEAVVRAAGEVVCSYFGEKSLNQRLGLGDKTLFDAEVFCPVLIQRMIREQDTIPSCGVMFTEEAEGCISHMDEIDAKGKIKTTGITLIQAAYGHNEGVVNSKVVVDSYVAQTISGRPVFYPIIREKAKRLKPGAVGLIFADNPEKLMYEPVLSYASLMTLKYFADALENYYGYPMDVEFVVRDNIIWVVQARPIVHKEERKNRFAGYLAKPEALGVLFKGRTIGAFGGALVEVDSQDQCIMNAKIGNALDEYLKSPRDNIISVFSGSDAPATSHEATTFRGEGKPVLYVYDLDGLRQTAFANPDKKIIFSPQQHCAAVISRDEQPEVKQGWISYPLPREISVHALLAYADRDGREDDKELFEEVPPLKEVNLQGILADLRSEDLFRVQHVARALPSILSQIIKVKTKDVALDADLGRQSLMIWRAARVLCKNIIDLCQEQAPLLTRLVPINYLEALLYQQPFDAKLGYISLATLTKALREEREESEEGLKFASPAARAFYVQLKKLTKFCYSEEAQQAWQQIIRTLTSDGQISSDLALLVKQLAEFELVPLWLNSMMAKGVTQGISLKDCQSLVSQWQKMLDGSQQSFEAIRKLRKDVHTFDISRFAEPKQFNDAWRELTNLTDQFLGSDFMKIVDGAMQEAADTQSVSLVGIAVCSLMDIFIDVFDVSIKTMKGSNLWDLDKKLAAFKTMLEKYRDVLVGWTKRPVVQKKLVLESRSNKTTIDSYLGLIDGILEKPFNKADLEPTPGVDATVFAIGSCHDWTQDVTSNKSPRMAEDAYTIIHQSLLSCNAASMILCGAQHVLLSNLVQEYTKIIVGSLQDFENYGGLKQVGIIIDDKKMEAVYNITFGSHGCRIVLTQKVSRSHISMAFNFAGGFESESYRWQNAALIFIFYGLLSSSEIQVNKLNISAFDVVVKFLSKDNYDDFSKILKKVFEVVKTGANRYILSDLLVAYDSLQMSRILKSIKILQSFGNFGWNVIYNVSLLILEKNQEFDQIAQIAFDAVQNRDVKIQSLGISLFNKLIKQGYVLGDVFHVALQAAMKEKEEQSLKVEQLKRRLSSALIKKIGELDQFDGAIAIKAVKSQDSHIQRSGLNLFIKLVERGIEPELALDAAVAAFESSDAYLRGLGLKLFTEIIQKGVAIDQVIQRAQEMMPRKNVNIQELVVQLFIELIKKNYGFNEAAAAAAKALQSEDINVLQLGSDLFNFLFEKDFGFNQAALAAGNAMKSQNKDAQRLGFTLFKNLIKRGKAFEQAVEVAKESVQSSDCVKSQLIFLIK